MGFDLNLIIKGIAAFFAVALVGHSGAHVTTLPVKHRVAVAAAEEATDKQDNPIIRGRGNVTFAVPPPPPPAPAPVAEAPAETPVEAPLQNQPIAQLPIAAAPAPAPPAPAFVIGSTQQAMINQDRASAGLGGLNWSPCLAGIAYQSALRMARQGFISHAGGAQQSLGCGLGNQGGENVGYWSRGIVDGQLNTMFMNSPEHRANIMGPYHHVGTAWVVAANGFAYVAVEFN